MTNEQPSLEDDSSDVFSVVREQDAKIASLTAEIAAMVGIGKGVCGVCWTSAWAPCEEGTPNSFPDNQGGFMVCQMCLCDEHIRSLTAERDHLRDEIEIIAKGECSNTYCGYVPRILQARAALEEGEAR